MTALGTKAAAGTKLRIPANDPRWRKRGSTYVWTSRKKTFPAARGRSCGSPRERA